MQVLLNQINYLHYNNTIYAPSVSKMSLDFLAHTLKSFDHTVKIIIF